MSSERPAAVLFDLGNTLIAYYRSDEFEPVLRRCVAALLDTLRAYGGTEAAVDFASAFERAKACNRERDDHRVWPLAERLARVVSAAGEPLAANLEERLTAAFLAPIFATARIDPNAVTVLREIKGLGYRTAIVSNTPWGSPAGPWQAELARWGLLEEVDAAVFCVDVGWRKPAAPVFAEALRKLDVAAEDAWFVGDDPRWDVDGARRAGLRPLLLHAGSSPTPDSIAELRALPSVLKATAHRAG